MLPNSLSYFPASYADSRESFQRLGRENARWCQAYPLPLESAVRSTFNAIEKISLETLTVDVAYLGPDQPERLVMVTSGLHGVEGFFGAAVQLALLAEADQASLATGHVGMLLIHALNPVGYAHRRRGNESSVDLNRNFLLPGDAFHGSPPGYGELDQLLNPACAPRTFEVFTARALLAIARYGIPALQQAVAGGQYDYPRGLFFGGAKPAATQHLLAAHLHDWLGGAERVVHLDFHTGLGRWGTHQLLISEPDTTPGAQWLLATFGRELVRSPHSDRNAYHARGDLGSWCANYLANFRYVYACAEFGTYGPLKILAGLRRENQAYWYTPVNSPARIQAANRLQELFCPASSTWRRTSLAAGVQLVRQALAALAR